MLCVVCALRSLAGLYPQHEVWHDGTSDRVILIADCWHPDLDVASAVYPLLDAAMLADVEAAASGDHRLLTERGYSTGERVSRDP